MPSSHIPHPFPSKAAKSVTESFSGKEEPNQTSSCLVEALVAPTNNVIYPLSQPPLVQVNNLIDMGANSRNYVSRRVAEIAKGHRVPMHEKCNHCVRTAICVTPTDTMMIRDKGYRVVNDSTMKGIIPRQVACMRCSVGSYAVNECVDWTILLKPKKSNSL